MLELVLHLYQVCSKIQTWASRLGRNHLYAPAILWLAQRCVLDDNGLEGEVSVLLGGPGFLLGSQETNEDQCSEAGG